MTGMVIHFICRGNVFRALIAEACLNSMQLKDITVLSSGTVAQRHFSSNTVNYRRTLELLRRHGVEGYAKAHFGDQLTQDRLNDTDVAVCMNKNVHDEARTLCKLPGRVLTWGVVDLGEPGRIAHDETEREKYAEDAYAEISLNVGRLVQTLDTPWPSTRLGWRS